MGGQAGEARAGESYGGAAREDSRAGHRPQQFSAPPHRQHLPVPSDTQMWLVYKPQVTNFILLKYFEKVIEMNACFKRSLK